MAETLSKKSKMEETGDPSRAAVARDSSRTVDVGGCFGESASDISASRISKFPRINLSSANFDVIVKSDAFIDKSLLIKTFYSEEEQAEIKKVLITATTRIGKSVNMDMLRKFFEIEVDKKGNPKTCVKKNKAGKWIEDEGKIRTQKNFALFKDNNLKIYQCQCKPGHTEEQMKSGQCASRQYFYEHCGQHPVLFMSFKGLYCDTWERLLYSFRSFLQWVFIRYKYLQASDRLLEDQREYFNKYAYFNRSESLSEQEILGGLERLISYLHTHFNKKVIILIDEFDAPIMRLIHDSEDLKLSYVKDVVNFISKIVSSMLKGNEHVLGGLMNAGVLLSRLLLYDTNNVEICPFLENHEFSAFYGFTEHEVEELLKRPRFKGFHDAAVLSYYSGYKVSGKATKLYNVYSILNYLRYYKPKKHISYKKSYWVEDHGMTDLNKLFSIEEIRDKVKKILHEESYYIDNPKKKPEPHNILELKTILEQYSIIPNTGQDKLFLLYLKDRGYFNVIHENNYSCTLRIPDGEIKDLLIRGFYDREYYQKKYNYSSKLITEYSKALRSLDVNKPETLKELVNSIDQLYSESVPMPENHDEFKAALIAFNRLSVNVYVEKQTVGLLIHRENDGTEIIMEYKWGSNENEENGLKQIFDNQYYKAYEHSDIHNKIFIGMHFSELRKVNICASSTNSEEWAVVVKNMIRYPKSEN